MVIMIDDGTFSVNKQR